MQYVDLISDLHENTWNGDISCESVHPMKWERGFAPILVIIGDVTDSMKETCDLLRNNINGCYDTVLFVDGNHDHADEYPQIHPHSAWESSIREVNRQLTSTDIVYLPSNVYVTEGVAFVGACGWWDYENGQMERNIDLVHRYFDDWVGEASKLKHCPDACTVFASNAKKRGDEEVDSLRERIRSLDKDDSVHSIVVVTHTPPILDGIDGPLPTYMHSQIATVLHDTSKVTHWLFGHTHNNVNTHGRNGVQFVAHPRGSRFGAGTGGSGRSRAEYHPLTLRVGGVGEKRSML